MVEIIRLTEASKAIKALARASPAILEKKTSEEEQEEAARVKRFLALPVRLQEGILRYGEHIQKAYRS